jgi:uncharacterized membrane protein HdeD (DUF308 family)
MEGRDMADLLGRNWWLLVIRGMIAIAFGILAFVRPQLGIGLLVTLLAAYLVADGISMLAAYVRGDPEARRAGWSVAVMGALGIVAGIAAIVWPNVTALSLLAIVAFWVILMGILQVVAAIRLRREIEGELLLAIGGLVSIALGVYLVVNPSDGLVSLMWLLGFWAILFGVLTVLLGLRLRVLGTVPASDRAAV